MKYFCNFKVLLKKIATLFFIALTFSVYNLIIKQISYTSSEDKVKWCWTKSMINEPSFTLDAKNGGMNWGYCVPEQKKKPENYFAIVDTSNILHSETK